MPAPAISFKGMDFQNWGAGWPSDPNGDVGPNHYIQTVNTSIQIFNKDGSTAFGPTWFDTFFSTAVAPCGKGPSGLDSQNNRGDPVVFYDQIADRWVITDFAWLSDSGPFYECIAVSKTSDPVSGGWWLYTLKAHDTWLNDYPKFGVWADGYYMSANLFQLPDTFKGARVWAFNRNELINGAALHAVAFDIYDGGLLPANLRGALPPAGSPEPFVDLEPPNALHVWQFHVDWATPANSTFTGPTSVAVASFAMFPGVPQYAIPQKGSSKALDQIDDRFMMQAQYRRIGSTESLWLNHTIDSGGVGAVRWYELRDPNGAPAIYQQGTYKTDTSHRWMASLAVDGAGNMAIGYSVSSSTMYPAIRYAGRLATDPPGQLAQGETSVIEGAGSQTANSRWGDYSAMTIDPVDDCTFWYTTEYYEATGLNWQTRIASFRYPSCPSGFAKQSPAPGAGGLIDEVTLSWSAVAGATSYSVCVDTTNNNTCDTAWQPTTGTSTWYGALAAGTYYWQVRAITTGTIEADGGNWWSFTVTGPEAPPPPPPPPPSPPQDPGFVKLAPANSATVLSGDVLVSWSVVPGALYRVCVDATNNNACDAGWRYTTEGSLNYSGLAQGTYYWQVEAEMPSGTIPANADAWWSFIVPSPLSPLPSLPPAPLPSPPPDPGFGKQAPENSATGVTSDVTITWWPEAPGALYRVCVDTTNNKSCDTGWKSTVGTSIKYTALSPGTYYWQVRADTPLGTAEADGGAWWSFTVEAPMSPPLPGSGL
jgi:hypothetical protein